MHVTGGANFEDSLNDTGVIAFLSPDDMIVLVGEDEGAGLEGADLFHVHIDPAGRLAIANLSRTGPPGDSPPFDYGRLVSADGMVVSGVELLSIIEAGGEPSILATSRVCVFGPTLGFAGRTVHVTAGNQGEWVVLVSRPTSIENDLPRWINAGGVAPPPSIAVNTRRQRA